MAIGRITAGLAAGLAVAGLLATGPRPAVAAPAASASARWHATEVDVPAGGSAETLDGIACTATSCTAGGSYYHSPSGLLAMIAAEAGGRWGTAVTVALPANAQPKNGSAVIASVSCPSATSCVAVGNYETTSASLAGLITTGHAATWSPGSAPVLPANAAAVPDAYLTGVSCTSASACVAVGGYTNTSHNEEAVVVARSGGRWRRALAIRPPAKAAANPAAHFSAVSCPTRSHCVAVGAYTTRGLDDEVMAAVEVRGRWQRATQIRMPANASGQPVADLYSVSCSSARDCVATGSYADKQAQSYPLIVSYSRGRWQRATGLTRLPGGAKRAGQSATLNAVSCTAHSCTAAGSYENTRGVVLAMVVARARGRWGRAVRIRLPSGAASGSAQDATLFGIACHGTRSCTAAGSYAGSSSAHAPEAMAVTRS